MKTIIKDNAGGMTDGLVLRLSDEKAADQVKNHHYKYCPKSVWKKQVRDKDTITAKEAKKSFMKREYADMALAETLVEKPLDKA